MKSLLNSTIHGLFGLSLLASGAVLAQDEPVPDVAVVQQCEKMQARSPGNANEKECEPKAVSETRKGREGRKGRNRPAFPELDLNGDGVVALDEFNEFRSARIAKRSEEGRPMKNLGNAPSFADIDTNGDGGMSPEEFNAHLAEHQKQRKSKFSSHGDIDREVK